VLVALYIAIEAPVSRMSLNPARSVASALPSGIWHGIRIYLTASALGMLLGLFGISCGAGRLNRSGHG
jgi:aquaporin Z